MAKKTKMAKKAKPAIKAKMDKKLKRLNIDKSKQKFTKIDKNRQNCETCSYPFSFCL